MTVMDPYTNKKRVIHDVMGMKTVWLTLNEKTRTPAKKRKGERCSRAGNVSTANGTRILSTPLEKNARIRARFSGLDRGGWVIPTYRCDHCRNIVANRPQVRLITKLKNQSEFTQTAYVGGENGGGIATAEGMEVRGTVTFGSARV